MANICELFKEVVEENQTRKILEIAKDAVSEGKSAEEIVEKIKSLLDNQ